MFKKFKKWDKLKKDSGSSILVTFIIATPLIALLCGLAIDVTKNTYLSNSYDVKGQSAIQSAVKTIDARGSLNNSSIEKLVKEFSYQTGGGVNKVQTSETAAFESDFCSTAEITNYKGKKQEVKLPYYEVTLGTERGIGKDQTSVATGENKVPKIAKIDAGVQYKVISADIYTSSQNTVLGMAGMPCQVYRTSVSAIAFGSNSDI